MDKEERQERRKESFQKVEQLAKARGVTFYRVAEDLGFPRSLFSDWKNGKSMPKMDKLIDLANYFGVRAEYFY